MLTALCVGVLVVAYCGGVGRVFGAGMEDRPGPGFCQLGCGMALLLLACLAAMAAVAVNH